MDDMTRRDMMVAAAGTAGVVLIAGPDNEAEAAPSKKPKARCTEFIIRLHCFKLPASEEARIAKVLQKALTGAMGKVDLKKHGLAKGVSYRYPNKEWLGIIAVDKKLNIKSIPSLRVNEIQK